MVEVRINNQTVEILNAKVKYVKQANDLADVTTVNTSYSYSLTFPKTPINTKIFKGLGLVGSTSRIPYQKNTTQLIDNGSMIITNGVSTVKSTGNDYKLVIQDGIIDFFRAIENKTIGDDLDLSSLSHTKNDTNIVASFTNPDYRYLISEYNGYTVKDGAINPDYQVPSINDKYIFDKIMAFSGYTYEGLPDISGEWTTFPTPPNIPTDEEILRFKGFYSVIKNIDLYEDWQPQFTPAWTNVFVYAYDFLQLQNNWKLKVIQTANYRANFDVTGSMLYGVFEGNVLYTLQMPIKMSLYRNNQKIESVTSPASITKDFTASSNDLIHFFPETLTRQEAEDRGIEDERFLDALDSGDFYIAKITIGSFNAEISTMGVEIFDFGDAFKDYSMTDFIKEVFFRKSLTPFPDVNARHIVFKTLSQRVDTNDYIDWTSKYMGRTNEQYTFGGYAKQNSLTMKHDNDDETFGNGYLSITDDNLEDNKTIFQSRYYAPSGALRTIPIIGSEFFLEIKFWEREIKEDDGVQSVEYKSLSNRFFLLKEVIVNKTITIGSITVSSFPKANISGTKMSDVVNEYYNDWGVLFNDLKIHDIDLALNGFEVSSLRLDVPYYFKQEGAFYILNKLSYESGKPTSGEFLKINS